MVPSGDEELAGRIGRHFLGGRVDIRLLAAVTNSVFGLRVADERWVLKLSRAMSGKALAKETSLIGLVRGRGIPVPVVEQVDADGALFGRPFLLLRGAGERSAAAWCGSVTPAARRIFREMGEVLARIHAISSNTLGRGVSVLEREHPDYYRARLSDLERWAAGPVGLAQSDRENFRDCLLSLPPLGGDALCHGDFHALHCIVRGERIAAVVDWENAVIGDPSVDLSLTHAYLDFYTSAPLIECFLGGYGSVRPLPRDFSERYRPVRALHALTMLREWRERGQREGAERSLRLFRDYSHCHRG